MNDLILAGDIGGTKVNIGLFSRKKIRPRLHTIRTYESRRFSGLAPILKLFLAECNLRACSISQASFAIAGPIIKESCNTTNLPWKIKAASLRKLLQTGNVSLINDVAATAYSVPFLRPQETVTLNQGIKRKGTIGVVAPGTGLGEAFLYWDGLIYHPIPTEGGHADFAPRSALQAELWDWLSGYKKHVSVEQLISGPGLALIFDFLLAKSNRRPPQEIVKASASQKPAIISAMALSGKDLLCKKALNIFVSLLGAEAGNLALKGMTLGGVYLGGGIAPKIIPLLKKKIFMDAFTDKGRFHAVLSEIPVKVILNDRAALIGAALYAAKN
ncbi:MAG: glucokinase [Pseudomonadota bacterium]